MEISQKVYSLVAEAERELADIFAEIDRVSFENKFCRRDIGARALAALK